MSSIDRGKIARNTTLLYIRMGIILILSLYTSRVVLDALGAVDMGIYNAVGGIVLMFSFLSGTMSTSCQKFLAGDLGRGDFDAVRRTFSTCVMVFALIALIVAALSETLGLWLLHSRMQTAGRDTAAMWVFQLSIISFIFTIARLPFQGMVIVREKMKVFAYSGVVESLGMLAIALAIRNSGADRLILYSALMLGLNAAVSIFYIAYCNCFWEECRPCRPAGRKAFGEIFAFAGWNMLGSLAGVCKTQGINILLNIFFGPAVNAARAMAFKAGASIQQFIDNFFTAVRPQILKSYAAGEKREMLRLVCQSSRISYFLMFILALPVLFETPLLLDLWLKDVPAHTVAFTRLILLNALVEALDAPLYSAMQACGRIRNFQIVCSGTVILILPLSWLLLRGGCAPESVFILAVAVNALSIALRVGFVHHCVGLEIRDYLRGVLVPVLGVSVAAAIIPAAAHLLIEGTAARFITVCISCVACTGAAIWFTALTKGEKDYVINLIHHRK